MFIRAKMTGGFTWRQPNLCYRTLPKFSQISWSPNHMKLMRYCSTPTQVSGMSIVRQFLWWDTPTDTPKRSPPKNWARSAEVRTTWDLWDIVQDHPRYQEWTLPDTLSGGIPPTDRHTKIELDQLKSVPHETYGILFSTISGIKNEHCQTVSVVGYPWQTLPNGHPQNSLRSDEVRTKLNLWDVVQHHPRYQKWALPDSLYGGVPLADTPKNWDRSTGVRTKSNL